MVIVQLSCAIVVFPQSRKVPVHPHPILLAALALRISDKVDNVHCSIQSSTSTKTPLSSQYQCSGALALSTLTVACLTMLLGISTIPTRLLSLAWWVRWIRNSLAGHFRLLQRVHRPIQSPCLNTLTVLTLIVVPSTTLLAFSITWSDSCILPADLDAIGYPARHDHTLYRCLECPFA